MYSTAMSQHDITVLKLCRSEWKRHRVEYHRCESADFMQLSCSVSNEDLDLTKARIDF